MTKGQLEELIERMCVEEKCASSDESIRWHACREAEKISDSSLFPILQEFISLNSEDNKKDKKIRRAIYFIIGKMLQNSFDENLCKFLIERLNIENDKYALSEILDLLSFISIPEKIDISPLISCCTNDKWLIRYSAIQALGASATKESKEMITYYLNQTDYKKYKDEIIYANVALGKIGNIDDIPILEKYLTSRIRDIKISAKFAIENIKSRNIYNYDI